MGEENLSKKSKRALNNIQVLTGGSQVSGTVPFPAPYIAQAAVLLKMSALLAHFLLFNREKATAACK